MEIHEYEEKIAALKRQLDIKDYSAHDESESVPEETEYEEEIVEEIVEYVDDDDDEEYEEIVEEVEVSTSTAPPEGGCGCLEETSPRVSSSNSRPESETSPAQPKYDTLEGTSKYDFANSDKAKEEIKKQNNERLGWEKPSWAKAGGSKLKSSPGNVAYKREQEPKTSAPESASSTTPKKKFGIFRRGASKKSAPKKSTPDAEHEDQQDGEPSKQEEKRLGFFSKTPKPSKKTTVYKKVPIKMEDKETSGAPETAPPLNKHAWTKPGWALPAETLSSGDTIQTESIQNNLKKAGTGGYERKVFAKEIRRIEGKFQEAREKVPPRLAWIVIFQKQKKASKKVGKIVIHLYGKDVNGLVDRFLDVKGCPIEKNGSELVVDTLDPKFFVTTNKKNISNRPGVFGLVQEGKEYLDEIIADPGTAPFFIKQAHIFPVKKAKGG